MPSAPRRQPGELSACYGFPDTRLIFIPVITNPLRGPSGDSFRQRLAKDAGLDGASDLCARSWHVSALSKSIFAFAVHCAPIGIPNEAFQEHATTARAPATRQHRLLLF